MTYQGIIHRYSPYLPVGGKFIVTLLEGNTPLLKADRLKKKLGLPCELYLKFEGLNPTGSFKDRGMTYAVSKAAEEGRQAIICASTGNTSASAAAYAAKAGMQCTVLIPEGQIAFGKLSQAMIHGAKVVQIRGNFDAALKMVVEIGKKFPVQIVNSINPYRLQGQKTAAFEVCEDLGRAPDYHFLPVGNAGNITAYWAGYQEWLNEGKISVRPKMMGFQAAGAAPIVDGKPVLSPKTIASAIRIGNPASWKGALVAAAESGGAIDKVTDAEIVKAYQLIARTEGYFCEPASAASLAGVIKQRKKLKEGDLVVCTLTGHGLKDPDTAIAKSAKPVLCDAKFEKIVKALKL
ncbi:MAG: threonine synthase [Deltaproteobacteria bacterium]|nr:threonine synthase [Deltaproteobacteria bacterium]